MKNCWRGCNILHHWHNGVENQLVADPRVPLDPHLRSRLLNRSRPHPRKRSVLPVGRRASRGPLPLRPWCLSSGSLERRAQRAPCEQMTARIKGLVKVVTRIPRATTSATEASTVHTSQHEQESTTKSTSGSQCPFTSKFREIRPRAPRNCRRTCIHCRTKRREEKYKLHL